MLLQRALYTEVGRCDIPAAIDIYRSILEMDVRSSRVSAMVHLRLGICYRLIGNWRRAAEHLRTVAEVYPSERKAAQLARRYLGTAVREDPALFMPEDIGLYTELVNPAEQVRNLAEVLKGTPLENPVDYALSYLASRPEEREPERTADPPQPPWVRFAAAVLNKGFLSELQKIDGLAIGIPAGKRPEESHLGVFFPGRSDVLRGIGSLFLSQERLPSRLHSFLVFQLGAATAADPGGEAAIYLALRDDAILWGRPRSLVEDAVSRYHLRQQSLATLSDFRKATSQREGSIIFTYLSGEWIDLARRDTSPEEQTALDAAVQLLGSRSIHPVTLAASTDLPADALRVRLQAWIEEGVPHALWDALRTEPLTADLCHPATAGCVLHLAVRADRALERVRTLLEGVDLVADRLAEPSRGQLRGIAQGFRAWLLAKPLDALLAEIRAIRIGLAPAETALGADSLFIILDVEDADRAARSMEESLQALLAGLIRAEPPPPVLTRELSSGEETFDLRFVEPLPGLRLGFVRRGGLLVVSPSDATIERVLLAMPAGAASPEGAGDGEGRETASKILLLRPSAILDALPSFAVAPEMRQILQPISSVTIQTRETPSLLAVELVVPRISTAVREILSRITAMEDPAAGASPR